ncbi:hypothetical protein Cob_v006198 [Colletotrichum orbiculare MAFF 240422]|uniref:Extracellular membrane protein CFEM domain-containing protein n=1 Tax=Colletotrichum orbiculare (strain 104-T / ATCC 96160 / CBS 514.97 / LARS 414 / MAFF 240422) TaxID=1213857 RepID=N4V9T7_COLOR|nr:hypothetical protein Cob_v006198 [Colletotrichum orbiculare MAFF 240422]
MSPRRRHRIFQPSSLLLSYLASTSHAAFKNDFAAYPAASRSCLDSAAAASGCNGDTVMQMNTCLCGNGGNFVTATAKCVAKTVKDQLDDVYEMLLTSCTDSKTPLAVSQAQFLDADDDDDDAKSTASSQAQSTTFSTSTTAPPNAAATTPSASFTPLTTYKSVANGVTVTVTRGIESVPTGTNVGKGSDGQSSSPDSNKDDDKDGNNNNNNSNSGLAAGLVGGAAVLIGALAFFCYRRRKQRQARAGEAGVGGKFGALSSATSLATMNSPPKGAANTTQYHGVAEGRPSTAGSTGVAGGAWHQHQHQNQPQQQQQQQQQQQHHQGNVGQQYWQQQQQNAPNPYGQPSGTWPSPIGSSNGPTGNWGVSPVSQYPHGSSAGPPGSRDGTGSWNAHAAAQNGTWNGQTSPQNATWNAQAVPVPAPMPHPSASQYAPVFELPGDETRPVEADSTPIGPAQPAPAHHASHPSSSIQSTPQMHHAQPAQAATAAAAARHMSRQIDDALQISRVELPPPRYSGPSSEWVSEDKKFG